MTPFFGLCRDRDGYHAHAFAMTWARWRRRRTSRMFDAARELARAGIVADIADMAELLLVMPDIGPAQRTVLESIARMRRQ